MINTKDAMPMANPKMLIKEYSLFLSKYLVAIFKNSLSMAIDFELFGSQTLYGIRSCSLDSLKTHCNYRNQYGTDQGQGKNPPI